MNSLQFGNDIKVTTNYNPVRPDMSSLDDAILKKSMSGMSTSVKLNRFKSPIYSYFAPANTRNTQLYQGHEYELYEYSRIIDTEAIVAKTFERKRALIFKNGYGIASADDKNEKYIKQRLKEFAYVTGITFEEFIKDLAYNLVAFHNAYVLTYRNIDKSTGKMTQYSGKDLEPIAALFNLPTESIERVLDQDGTAKKYKQKVSSSKYRIYRFTDVEHITYNRRTGFTMGTPPLEAVKDDILALRRIEESVETLIYKSLFPIVHVKVGTEKDPAKVTRDGTSEVEVASRILRNLEDNGGVCTSERIEIKAIGSESLALRVESYLAYFKNRVMIGLGVSAVDLGEGDASGKATGEIISQTLKEAVIDYQQVICDFIENKIFAQLLVESGRYKAEYQIPEEEWVNFQFTSVDADAVIKTESHAANMHTQGLFTVNEARKHMKKKPLDDKALSQMGDQKALAMKGGTQIEQEKKNAEVTNKATLQKASQTVAKKAAGAANASKSKTKPKNQYRKDSFVTSLRILMDDKEIISSMLKHHFASLIDVTDSAHMQKVEELANASTYIICNSVERDIDLLEDLIQNTVVNSYLQLGEI